MRRSANWNETIETTFPAWFAGVREKFAHASVSDYDALESELYRRRELRYAEDEIREKILENLMQNPDVDEDFADFSDEEIKEMAEQYLDEKSGDDGILNWEERLKADVIEEAIRNRKERRINNETGV